MLARGPGLSSRPVSAEPSTGISIVLCTRNRARLLERALASLGELEHPKLDFELLVIDNASSDRTPAIARAFAERAAFPVRVLSEPRAGLSHARNRGAAEARGRHLLFTDDDQRVHRAWLVEHRRVAERWGARVVQGAIELAFVDGRPDWLHGKLESILGRTLPLPEGPADIDLYGGNVAIERSLLLELGGFEPELGKGASGWGEDSELSRRLSARRERVVYAPGAIVEHLIEADRTTPEFFRRAAFEKGCSDGLHVAFGAGAVLTGTLSLAADALGLGWARARRNRHRALLSETRALTRLGRAWGTVHRIGRT